MEFKPVVLVQEDFKNNGHKVIEDTPLWKRLRYQMGISRGSVYYQEKNIDLNILDENGCESDEYDPYAVHFAVYNNEELPIAVCRILEMKRLKEHGIELPIVRVLREQQSERNLGIVEELCRYAVENNRNLAEGSRLIVNRKYRKSLDKINYVYSRLMTLAFAYALDTGINDFVCTSGTRGKDVKKSSSEKLQDLGLRHIKGPYSNEIATNFYYKKFNDTAELLHLDLSKWNLRNLPGFEEFMRTYKSATFVKIGE